MRKSNIFICTSYLIVTRKAQFYQRGRLSRLYSRTRETAAITKDPQIKWLKISLILIHLLCSQKADRRAFLYSIIFHTLRLKVIENLLSEQWWLLGQRERSEAWLCLKALLWSYTQHVPQFNGRSKSHWTSCGQEVQPTMYWKWRGLNMCEQPN